MNYDERLNQYDTNELFDLLNDLSMNDSIHDDIDDFSRKEIIDYILSNFELLNYDEIKSDFLWLFLNYFQIFDIFLLTLSNIWIIINIRLNQKWLNQ